MDRPEYEQMYRAEDEHWWFVHRRRLAANLVERWLPGLPIGRILDVGCGTGGNLAAMAGWGQRSGLDLSPVALDLARGRRLPGLAQASSLGAPYSSQTFDLVTAFDVFYHRWVVDDQAAIAECYRVLCPGGWLLLTDSALPGLWSSHDETYYARQRYTLADICQKLERAGFQITFCSYTNTLLLPLFVATRLAMRWLRLKAAVEVRVPPAPLNRLLINLHRLEEAWLGRGKSLPLGSSLVCLAQKPAGPSNQDSINL